MSQKKEKSKGTVMAEKTRSQANQLTDEQRQQNLAKAMQLIYGGGQKACVNRR